MRQENDWMELTAPTLLFGGVAVVLLREFTQMSPEVRGNYLRLGLGVVLFCLAVGYVNQLNNSIMGWRSNQEASDKENDRANEGGDGGSAASDG